MGLSIFYLERDAELLEHFNEDVSEGLKAGGISTFGCAVGKMFAPIDGRSQS